MRNWEFLGGPAWTAWPTAETPELPAPLRWGRAPGTAWSQGSQSLTDQASQRGIWDVLTAPWVPPPQRVRDPAGAQAVLSPRLSPRPYKKSLTDPTAQGGRTCRAPRNHLPGKTSARAWISEPESFHRPTVRSEGSKREADGKATAAAAAEHSPPPAPAASSALRLLRKARPLPSAHRCALCVTPPLPPRGHRSPPPPKRGGTHAA